MATTEHTPRKLKLVQATFDDIMDRQLLYIRGHRAIVTCIDYPLIFWRYINCDLEKEYVDAFIDNDQLNNVHEDRETLSASYYQTSLSQNDMGRLLSSSEYHRSFESCPSIFQIASRDKRVPVENDSAWAWHNYDDMGIMQDGLQDDDMYHHGGDWANFDS